ncbi:Sulfotransferase family-containing protein [Strongyloides ratti]|uniref:Sulfotransferase family-containing protein n=1 Tax=Strongyloides ratti TaxID=34506 RepID=A0A090L9F9_STRRB|nr:Sulfotransferase family-containing protein [Strongyloides ratti]CEF64748.1 Sulfotransferase family-containing protein [Strongyloides ratti]
MSNYSIRSEYASAPKYKLNTCYTGKSFSSMSVGLFCYLFDEKSFLKNYKSAFNKGANRHLCQRRNRNILMRGVIKDYSNNNSTEFFNEWKNIYVVRNPISRFISGFVQICLLKIGLPVNHPFCFNCKRSMSCFLSKLYNKIIKFKGMRSSLDRFLVYHFFPQKWQCEYYKYKDNYTIIHYESNKTKFYDSYLEELKTNGVPSSKLIFIKKLLYTTKPIHKTDGKHITNIYTNYLKKSHKLLNLLVRIFYEDFIEFNFPLPNIF